MGKQLKLKDSYVVKQELLDTYKEILYDSLNVDQTLRNMISTRKSHKKIIIQAYEELFPNRRIKLDVYDFGKTKIL